LGIDLNGGRGGNHVVGGVAARCAPGTSPPLSAALWALAEGGLAGPTAAGVGAAR
jgi:hypothetical protein